ncbi:MAG: MerR family transcriptional regulator [Microbacteriaceae bacterium]
MVAQAAAGGPNRSPALTRNLLSIGQVLAKLSAEFPDLTPSKLRFFEDQGLITPSRTESGYRKFSAQDLERLRFILALQRDNYLPLKVIKKYLDEVDQGLNPKLPINSAPSAESILVRGTQLSKDELIKRAGATAMLFQEAVSSSLIPAAEVFNEDALHILKALVELQHSGIEPRHLRGYRAAIDRDLGLIEVALLPYSRRKDASNRAKAAELAKELTVQLETVRNTLLRSAINKFGS